MTTRVMLRLDFDAGCIGPGKIALLEAIRDTGSISVARLTFEKMSYRQAWELIEQMNRIFAEPVVLTKPGGLKGGGAALTPTGECVVACYRKAEQLTRDIASPSIACIEMALAAEQPPGTG